MKRFFNSIFLFLFALAIFSFFIDIIASRGLKHCNKNHLETFNAIMNSEINSDFIILGNSRATCSYNTEVIDKILSTNSFNLGVSGQPFGVSYLRYHLYRRNNIAPKEMIINIDYCEMNLYSNGFERQQYLPYFGPFFSYNKDPLFSEAIDANGFKWVDKHLPLVRYRGDYKYLWFGLLEFFHIQTFSPYTNKGFYSENVCYDGTNFRGVLESGEPIICQQDNEAFNRLDLLLHRCNTEHVKVYLVYAPIFSSLTQHIDSLSAVSLMNRYSSLVNKYSKIVNVLDYSDPNSPICRDSSVFKDANHLNLNGSIEFSTILSHDIVKLQSPSDTVSLEINLDM